MPPVGSIQATTTSSTEILAREFLSLIATSSGMAQFLDAQFGPDSWVHDPRTDYWFIANARAPGSLMAIDRLGRTVEFDRGNAQ
jgi:hypothetical protein